MSDPVAMITLQAVLAAFASGGVYGGLCKAHGHGAVAAPEKDARLLEWTIEVPDAASVREAAESFARVGY